MQEEEEKTPFHVTLRPCCPQIPALLNTKGLNNGREEEDEEVKVGMKVKLKVKVVEEVKGGVDGGKMRGRKR